MRVKVLGCSGGIAGDGACEIDRTTALQLDDDILIDCGTGVGVLSLEQMRRIDHVFVTHAHLDHVAMLPMLADSVGSTRPTPLVVHASTETLQALGAHVFNDIIWPDFTRLPSAARPFLRFEPIEVGSRVYAGQGRSIAAVPALHSVPAQAYVLSSGCASLAFSGDTTVCEEMIHALNAIDDLRYLLIETAFANEDAALAQEARHLCPTLLRNVLDRLTGSPEIFVTHLKPGQRALLAEEIGSLRSRLTPHLLNPGQVFHL